jgi:enoyl-CoA hydratase/carnithine racemase
MTGPVTVERSGSTWNVTLDRPQQGNAFSADLVAELSRTFGDAVAQGAEAIVLRGAGKHFCTGFDLSNLDGETDDTLLARFVRIELLLQQVARAPLLTVAVAHGRVMGAGADLFAACTVRAVQGDASFAFPGARGFGLVLGTRRLTERVGTQTALEWVESARAIPAEEALRTGLATVRAEQPADVDGLIAARTLAHEGLRDALARAASPSRAQDDASDLERLVHSAARRGLRDGIAAYLEKVKARQG